MKDYYCNNKILVAVISFFAAMARTLSAEPFNYDIQTTLTYRDSFGKSSFLHTIEPNMYDQENWTLKSGQPRALGLSKARFGMTWQSSPYSALYLVLRPDALSARSEAEFPEKAREFDNREGESYKQSSTLQFLDAYQLILTPGSSLDFSAGVFERLTDIRSSYPVVLGYALTVMFPEKFSAIKTHWHQIPHQPVTTLMPNETLGIQSDLYVYQGHEDRAETISETTKSFDKSTVAKDPYYGIAINLSSQPSLIREFGILAGYDDTKVARGKKNQVYGQLYGIWKFPKIIFPLKTSLDLRIAKDKWNVLETSYLSLLQQSFSITNSLMIVNHQWFLFGFHYGTSERHPIGLNGQIETGKRDEVKGWKLDFGLQRQLGNDFDVILLFAQERRDLVPQDGDQQGAFKNEAKTRDTSQRIGLELNYNINGDW